MRGLADYADILDEAAPDFLRVLDNLSFINRSLVDQEDELNTFLTSTTGFAGEMESFLAENEQRFITLAADSLPSLQVLARYSPEFPCLAEGLARQSADRLRTIGDSFGGLQPGLHITLEVIQQREGYQPRIDEPQFKDDRGPECYGMPEPRRSRRRTSTSRTASATTWAPTRPSPRRRRPPSPPAPPSDPAAFLAPTSQRQMLDAVVAPVMGVPVDEVPDLAQLLFGPVARGTVVGLAGGDR